MTLEEISEKHGLRLSHLQRAAEMLRVVIEIEYLDAAQKIQILTFLQTARDQPPPTTAQQSCLKLKGPERINQLEEILSSDEFTSLILGLGRIEAEQHLEDALKQIFNDQKDAIAAEADLGETRQTQEEDQSFSEQWTTANEAWIKADAEWRESKEKDDAPAETTNEIRRLPEIETDSLPSDNWEVALLIHDPLTNAHNMTLLKTGVRDQRIVPDDYSAINNGDIDKSAGALKNWGKADPNDKRLEELSKGAHCPHIKDKGSWALSLAAKSGDFDRIFLICIRLEHPNPSMRVEKANANGVRIERKRDFAFVGLGASCRSESTVQWPSSHLIQDPSEPGNIGWGIFTQRGDRRTVGEKWQVRAGWNLEFTQLKGPDCASELRIENAGSAFLNISGSGSHHGHIDAHAAAFVKIGHKGRAPIRLNTKSPPDNLVWENTVDYHTDVLKIPRAMDEIDLKNHSIDLREKRRPTIGGTRPFSSDMKKDLIGALTMKSGSISGSFVAETKLIHENHNKDQNCDFSGHSVSAWDGDLRFKLPMTPTETIAFDFSRGDTESKEASIDSDTNQRRIEHCRHRVATIKGPQFEWVMDQVSVKHVERWNKKTETINLSQQGWSAHFESPARSGEMEMLVEIGHAQTGFRLRKEGPPN